LDARPPDAPGPDASNNDLAQPDAASKDLAQLEAAVKDAGTLPPVKGLCSTGSWCWKHPLPQGHHLNSVWGTGASNVWAVGEGGTLLHFNGKAWSVKKAIAPLDFNAIHGDSTKLCAAGAKGAHYCDTGSGWNPVSSNTPNDLNGVWVGGGTIIVVGDGGVTQHFTGLSMVNKPSNVTANLRAVWGSGPSDVFAVGDKGTLLHFNGTSWFAAPMSSTIKDDLHAIFGLAKGHVLVAGSSGAVHRYSTAKGVEWSSKAGTDTLVGVWATGTKDLHVVDKKGGLHHFKSPNWSKASAPDEELTAIWGGGAGDIHAVGKYGAMMRHHGGKWKKRSSRLTEHYLWSVTGHGPANVVAVGNTGVALHYDGSTWKKKSTGWGHSLRGVWAGGTSDLFAVGTGKISGKDNSTVLHHTTPPGAWSSAAFGVKPNYFLNAIWGASTGKVFAIGSSGNSFVYDPTGKKWTHEQLPTLDGISASFGAIWGSSSKDIYAVSSNTKEKFLHHSGSSWQMDKVDTKATPGCGWYGHVWGASAKHVLFLQRTTPCVARFNGKTWSLASGLGNFKKGLNAIHGDGPSRIYMVGGAGVIVKYDWTADSAKDEQSGTFRNLNAIWGSKTAGFYAVGSTGIILHKK